MGSSQNERRVLVCGGRDFKDTDALIDYLDAEHHTAPIGVVIHGGAKGADHLAGFWAFKRGVGQIVYPANWTKYGKSAGPIRNAFMLADARPDVVIAFPGGDGTADMVERAKRAGVMAYPALAAARKKGTSQ